MAGISTSEMDQIQTQVSNFEANRSEDFDLTFTGRSTPAKKSAVTKRHDDHYQPDSLQADIMQLQNEVKDLQQKVELQRQQNKVLQTWQQYQDTREQCDEEDLLKAKIQGLKQQITTIRQVTDVFITRSGTSLIKQGKLWVDKEKTIEGRCGDVEFRLDINVHEIMKKDETVESHITDLSISTSENIHTDLKDAIERLSVERNAQGFLSLLPGYKTWCAARQKTFTHFTNKYPDIASLKSPAVIILSHPVKKCKFIVEWLFEVSDVNSVIPKIQLSVQVPTKVQSSSVIKTAPESFQLMLKELGIECALETLVSLLGT